MSTRLLWLYITFYITSYALDLGEKRDILDFHNSLRNDIAAMEPANLNQLFWDDGLSQLASSATCFTPDIDYTTSHLDPYLEFVSFAIPNTAVALGKSVGRETLTVIQIVQLWAYGEEPTLQTTTYPPEPTGPQLPTQPEPTQPDTTTYPPEPTGPSGPPPAGRRRRRRRRLAYDAVDSTEFAQMAWDSTRYVGCGYDECSSDNLLICLYYPAGNIQGEQAYTTAAISCSACDADRDILCDEDGIYSDLCGGGLDSSFNINGLSQVDDCDDGLGRIVSPQCSTVGDAVYSSTCELGENYFFVGHPAFVNGDPHFKTWSGDYHDFQGVGSFDNQYYYITSDAFSTKTDLPFNMLGKHRVFVEGEGEGPPGSVRAFDYITLQLFDANGDYYLIFLSINFMQYTAYPVSLAASTLYADHDGLSTFIVGAPQPIGQLFVAHITEIVEAGSDSYLGFTLTVGGECSISLEVNVWMVFVFPPTCFQCHIAGLLGDFIQPQIEGTMISLQACDGSYINVDWGWEGVHDTAYSANGISWSKSHCVRPITSVPTRRRLEELVGAPAGFVYVDLCPSGTEVAIAAIDECATARNEYSDLCDAIGVDLCDRLQVYCNYDACAAANGDIDAVPAQVDALFVSVLYMLSNIDGVAAAFDVSLLDLVFKSSTTQQPSDESSSDWSSDSDWSSEDFLSLRENYELMNENENGSIERDVIITFDESVLWNVMAIIIVHLLVFGCLFWCVWKNKAKKTSALFRV